MERANNTSRPKNVPPHHTREPKIVNKVVHLVTTAPWGLLAFIQSTATLSKDQCDLHEDKCTILLTNKTK
jgi:hypothetical protein